MTALNQEEQSAQSSPRIPLVLDVYEYLGLHLKKQQGKKVNEPFVRI